MAAKRARHGADAVVIDSDGQPDWCHGGSSPWTVLDTFAKEHLAYMARLSEETKGSARVKLVTQQEDTVLDKGECVTYQRLFSDKFMGDARLRAVQALLSQMDERGFERSANQERFHDAFLRASSRIIYREEWSVHRSAIMQHNKWATTPGEIMVSTPRRFGKTFRCVA